MVNCTWNTCVEHQSSFGIGSPWRSPMWSSWMCSKLSLSIITTIISDHQRLKRPTHSDFVFIKYEQQYWIYVYMLQSIVGTRHYRECLKFSGNTGNACDHQSLPVLPKIFCHYRECLKLRASFSQDCLKCFYSPNS